MRENRSLPEMNKFEVLQLGVTSIYAEHVKKWLYKELGVKEDLKEREAWA